MHASFISGPGQHKSDFMKVGLSVFNELHVFEHYPKFKKTIYKNRIVCSEKSARYFNLLEKKHAIRYLKLAKNQSAYNEAVYKSYAQFASKHISPHTKTIIAWPQVAFNTFRKFKGQKKLILDYPMIHPLEWQKILTEYTSGKKIHHERYIFSSKMLEQMLDEIEMADQIVVLSSFAKKTFIDNGVLDSKIIVNPLPVEADYIYQKLISTNNNKVSFVYVGRVDYLKGIYDLEQCITQCSSQNYTFTLAGELQDRWISHKLQEHSNVNLTGYLPSEQLIPLLQNSDFLILPSIQESFGRVVLNALALGTPVIVSNRSIGNDVVTLDNGYVFEAENTTDLLSKINLAASDCETWRNKRPKIADSVKNYTFDNYANNWSTILKHL